MISFKANFKNKIIGFILKGDLILYIDKHKDSTEYLLHFYDNKGFKILEENNVQYKMI